MNHARHARHARHASGAARPPLVLVPQHFGSLVFDRRTSRYAPFDHAATAVLRASADESVFAVAGDDDDETTQAFAEHFEREGYFRPDGRFAGVVLDVPPGGLPRDHLSGPLALHLEVIAACNLRCGHCFAGQLPRKADLTLAEMDDLFADLASTGSFRLGLTGGEPLLRKDLVEIVDAATARGLHPCLTTNGLLLDERIARSLGDRDLVWINVSLDGATPATNDALRGSGTFDEVTRRLRTFGRHMRFTLAFTITRANASEVRACAALARDLGAHTVVFRPLYPVGVARDRPELMPTFDQYTRALAELTDLGVSPGEGATLHPIDAFSPNARHETQAKTFAPPGCGAANLVASVSATGDVSPCSFLGAAFEAGNIRERPFSSIWRAGHAFVRMRGSESEEGPNGRRGFVAGCRARSLAAHGDVDAPDPWHDAWLAQRDGTGTGTGSGSAPPLATHHMDRYAPRRRLPVLSPDPRAGRS